MLRSLVIHSISVLLVVAGVACIPAGLALCVMAFIFAVAAVISHTDEPFQIAAIAFVIGVAVVVGGFLLIYASDRIMAKRVPVNCCSNCGYDLRGLPGRRCPECGLEQ